MSVLHLGLRNRQGRTWTIQIAGEPDVVQISRKELDQLASGSRCAHMLRRGVNIYGEALSERNPITRKHLSCEGGLSVLLTLSWFETFFFKGFWLYVLLGRHQ